MKARSIFRKFSSKKNIGIYTVVITFLSVLSISLFGLNLDKDLATANVIRFSPDEVISVDRVVNELNSTSIIEIEEGPSNTFQVFYRGESVEELVAQEESFVDSFGDLEDYQVLVYEPAEIFFVRERLAYGIYFSTFAYIIFLLFAYKGLNILRSNLPKLLLADVFLNVWNVLIGLGVVGIISALDVDMSEFFFVGVFGSYLIALAINIFVLVNQHDQHLSGSISNGPDSLDEKLIYKLQLFLAGVYLLLVIPLVFLGGSFVLIAPLFIVMPLFSLINNIFVRPYILKDIGWLLTKINLTPKSPFFQKEW